MKRFALISVSDKNGLEDFALKVSSCGYDIIATGKTARVIKSLGVNCTEISDLTKFPEIFSGRVKTLQPTIFGGILMRRNVENDLIEASRNNIFPIDIVCVNFYPFPEVVNRSDIDLQTKIENIDIGGPSLIRAAAKNYKFVSVLTNPVQYNEFIAELESGEISVTTREKLAYKAFAYTSYYDTLIANFFENEFHQPKENIRINYHLSQELRYGENPHQKAYLFGNFDNHFEILHGKELSYNNIIDLIAASELVRELGKDSCAIIKHTNPCGAAIGTNPFDAYEKALSCDPISAFGGIVAFSNRIDSITAEKLNEIFLEIIIAPEFDEDAYKILIKKKNRRLIKLIDGLDINKWQIRNVPGGIIAQSFDDSSVTDAKLKVVTEKKCNEKELSDLKFAWVVCKHTKSNAIVYVKDKKAIGVGAGQMSRVDSAKIAASKAKQHGHDLTGAVAASDAFFPFADGLLEIISHGITSVIQPGGSVRDEEVIKAADDNNISMVFTGIRNFKH